MDPGSCVSVQSNQGQFEIRLPTVDSDGNHGSCRSDENGRSSGNIAYNRKAFKKRPLSKTLDVDKTSEMNFMENQPQTGKNEL